MHTNYANNPQSTETSMNQERLKYNWVVDWLAVAWGTTVYWNMGKLNVMNVYFSCLFCNCNLWLGKHWCCIWQTEKHLTCFLKPSIQNLSDSKACNYTACRKSSCCFCLHHRPVCNAFCIKLLFTGWSWTFERVSLHSFSLTYMNWRWSTDGLIHQEGVTQHLCLYPSDWGTHHFKFWRGQQTQNSLTLQS